MLALLMSLDEDFEQFFPDCNRLSLMTDHLPVLHVAIERFISNDLMGNKNGTKRLTSDPTACSLNIFLTQNLFCLAKQELIRSESFIPKLGGLHCSVFGVNQHRSNVTCSFRVYQCFILFLGGQVLDVARKLIYQLQIGRIVVSKG
jgi:hypothetical protein